MNLETPVSLRWRNGRLILLDQTRLPQAVIYEEQHTVGQVWESIRRLKVRGAPALGVAAAYGLLTGLAEETARPLEEFKNLLEQRADYLKSARPTAVNPRHTLDRMLAVSKAALDLSPESLLMQLQAEARAIHEEDQALCRSIGEHGQALIKDGLRALTHCNAGALATTGLGTALAPFYLAYGRGRRFKVFAGETRPLLQGARLTAWELKQAGLDVTLICDNMAADLMSRHQVDLVLTGCDRVAANGDTANKIGTLGLAVLAAHYKIPFYVAGPSTSIDFQASSGQGLPIEQRPPEEVLGYGGRLAAAPETRVYNPSFDVTPAGLITAFITEKGLIEPPFEANLGKAFRG